MKIVDRKTFLQMPKGTVFCPIFCKHIDITEAYILDVHDSKHEYYEAKLGWMTYANGENYGAFFDMEKGLEREYEPFIVDTDLSENHDNTRYAIFSADEVQSLIGQLTQALKDGYGINKED